MKKILLFALVVSALGSCKKCHQCVAIDQDSVERYTYPEVCGTNKELSSYASECESQYGQFEFTCRCGEVD